MGFDIEQLKNLEKKFKNRYKSYQELRGVFNAGRAKAAKRAWLDVRRLVKDAES